jgi:hypothetical protein
MPTQNPTYSRRNKVEEKRNIRNAVLLGALTIGILILFVLYGFGILANFAVFLGDLKKNGQPIESNDQTPPIPPRFEPIPKSTNQREIDIQGSTEPGATVVMTLNGEESELLANSDGEFHYTAKLSEEDNLLSAYSLDDAGNKSNQTETQTITFDEKAPDLEVTRPTDGASLFGSRERQLVIEGKTEPDTAVSVNGRHVVVESTGNFTFLTSLSEGENPFTVKAQDKAGNITEKEFKVTYAP